jgi:hypothetical protein
LCYQSQVFKFLRKNRRNPSLKQDSERSLKPRLRGCKYPDESVATPRAGSGYSIMLTSLSQYQAQGWEKWLSWIRFAVRDRQSKIASHKEKVCPLLAIALLNPGSGYEFILCRLAVPVLLCHGFNSCASSSSGYWIS